MEDRLTYTNCHLCPRNCGVDRMAHGNLGSAGFCGESNQMRVAHIGPHFGEEPPLTGTKGSGTVFFSGCSLGCSFCQNHQISLFGHGKNIDAHELAFQIENMINNHQVHNINFVTPDHFFPHVFEVVTILRNNGILTPVIFNVSGYQSLTAIRKAEAYADIYLPDFKYSDPVLAKALSKCGNYPKTALYAISEMVRQKGFLDSFSKDAETAMKGVLIRHLILPGEMKNSVDALDMLYSEFGKYLPLSLMTQYRPVIFQKNNNLNRTISKQEFDKIYSHALSLGFENMFVQFPEESCENCDEQPDFLPDFEQEKPFKGNTKQDF